MSIFQASLHNNELIRKLLKRKNRPDGIFASVEKLAISTYEICRELGVRIPEDLKIITLSNSYMAGLLKPSLTTIKQQAFEMGGKLLPFFYNLSILSLFHGHYRAAGYPHQCDGSLYCAMSDPCVCL